MSPVQIPVQDTLETLQNVLKQRSEAHQALKERKVTDFSVDINIPFCKLPQDLYRSSALSADTYQRTTIICNYCRKEFLCIIVNAPMPNRRDNEGMMPK